jgi:predicted dehydrogenase
MESEQTLKVACLGITHPHASARVRALRAIDGVRVVAAADPDGPVTSFCKAYDMAEARIEEILLNPEIRAVLVHSKSDRLAEYGLRALDAGKAVLVEKPGGTGVADSRRLAEAVDRTGGILQIGYNCRFAESVTMAQDLLERGVLGQVVSVSAHAAAMLGEHVTAHLNQPADMGGGLWIIGCHVIDILLATCGGRPTTVNARVTKYASLSDSASREDAAAAIFSYPDLQVGFEFTVHDPLEWFETSRVTYYGTRGVLEVGILPERLFLELKEPAGGYPAGRTEWVGSVFTPPWARAEDNAFSELPELSNLQFFHTEARHFVRAIREGAPVPVSAQDALDVAEVIDACYRSGQATGGLIDLSSRP